MYLTKKIRTILFLALGFLLLISAPIFILYSSGYRFDFSQIRPIKTGAFYFKGYQSGIEVYLNGKFQNKINPIFKTLFIDNLLPKTYNIALKKDGFHSWEKDLEVKGELVTEIRNIYLFPMLPEKETVDLRFNNTESFEFHPDGKKAAIISKTDAEGKSNLAVYALDSKGLINIDDSFLKISELHFANDSEKMLILGEKLKGDPAWFLIDADYEKNSATVRKLFDTEKGVRDVAWNRQNSNAIYYLSKGLLFKYDIVAKTTTSLAKEVRDFAQNANNIFLLDDNGFLLKTDLNGKTPEKLSANPLDQFDAKNSYKIIISDGGSKIGILGSNNKFYLFDESKKSFEKISDSAENVKFLGNDRILYFGKKEVWVMWLSDYLVQPIRKAGDRELVARFSEDINDAMFFPKTNEHLILKVAGQIKIAELDSRDKRNIIDFTTAKGKIYYNDFDKKLYILDKNQLYAISI